MLSNRISSDRRTIQPKFYKKSESEDKLNTSPKLPKLIYWLGGMFFAGMLYGALIMRNTGVFSQLNLIGSAYIADKQNMSFIGIFISSVTSSGMFLALAFLLGFCFIGQPLAFFIPFVKGLGIGSYMGYMYVQYGWQGVGYCVLTVVPVVIISTFALILSVRESIRLSNTTLKSFLKETTLSKEILKLYITKNIILFLFLIAAGIIEVVVSLLFGGLFNL